MRCYILLLVLLLNVRDTSAQDSLIYNGKAYRAITNMLAGYPPYQDAVDSLQRHNNAWCPTHYKTMWQIQNDSLFLTNLTDECPAFDMQYGKLLGKGKTFAWWVNEHVYMVDTLPYPCYFNGGIMHYPYEHKLRFSSGRLIAAHYGSYAEKPSATYSVHIVNCNNDSILRHIYAGIDWSQLSGSLLEEGVAATIHFSTQERFPFATDIKITRTCCPTLNDNIMLAVEALSLPPHYRLGKFVPVYYMFKLVFNEANKLQAGQDNSRSR